MESNSNNPPEELSRFARKRVAALILIEIQNLIASFEKDKIANKRIAIVGMIILFLNVPAYLVILKTFNKAPTPTFLTTGTVLQTDIFKATYETEDKDLYVQYINDGIQDELSYDLFTRYFNKNDNGIKGLFFLFFVQLCKIILLQKH